MSNVIEFKKRPDAPSERSGQFTAEHYNLEDLLAYEVTETGYIDENQYHYEATPEDQAQLLAFFDAFGFDYRTYQTQYQTNPRPFVLWQTLVVEFSGDVVMCLKHPDTWNIVRNRRSGEHAAYVDAVARRDVDTIKRYRHVAEAKFREGMAKRDPDGNLPPERSDHPSAEATMFERGLKNFRWLSPFSYSFPAFERTSSGEYRHEGHDVFVKYAYVCGWSYADIARDKMRLEEVANICIGTLGLAFYRMAVTDGSRWNKAAAEKAFPGCSDKLLQYLSACYGRRVESARKLRDTVWSELQAWAKAHPFDRSLFGRT